MILMDRYRKEVIQVTTLKNAIMVQYLYNNNISPEIPFVNSRQKNSNNCRYIEFTLVAICFNAQCQV